MSGHFAGRPHPRALARGTTERPPGTREFRAAAREGEHGRGAASGPRRPGTGAYGRSTPARRARPSPISAGVWVVNDIRSAVGSGSAAKNGAPGT